MVEPPDIFKGEEPENLAEWVGGWLAEIGAGVGTTVPSMIAGAGGGAAVGKLAGPKGAGLGALGGAAAGDDRRFRHNGDSFVLAKQGRGFQRDPPTS